MAEAAPVHHHALLRRRGGAAGMARLLAANSVGGRAASYSFELDEPGGEALPGERALEPGELARQAAPGAIVHVHATRDWTALLEGFAATPRPLVVTVHDCTPLTGGCVYPLDCPLFLKDCLDPCPRAYPDAGLSRRLKRQAALAARPALAAPSRWMARRVQESWPGLPVSVIPNGVDIPDALPDKARCRSRLGIAQAGRVVLFLAHGGAQAGYKGGHRFAAIRQALAGLAPEALVVVAGGGEVRSGEGVIHLPYVEAQWLSALYGACDVLAYPSLADNHPLVVLEAMAHGLPVVSYAVGGIPEQFGDGQGGRLVPAGDEAGFVKAVAEILRGESRRRALAESGRARAERHFSRKRMAADYERLYLHVDKAPPGLFQPRNG